MCCLRDILLERSRREDTAVLKLSKSIDVAYMTNSMWDAVRHDAVLRELDVMPSRFLFIISEIEIKGNDLCTQGHSQ